ncbi:MAG TPA: NUDIX hydrolase [Rhodocyclaceae bacterium]|nr:NUDIX hydrolase [Rhodocyclaceae bacterium]
MNFCSKCSARVSLQIPAGDNLPRFVCENCGEIHYQNPKVVVGALATWEDRILLCKRAIEPRRGMWTLPAGFMENAETTGQAALRETLEEASARIELIDAYTLVNVPHISQVHIFYRAKLLDADFAAGVESLEVGLFGENEIPWQDIAFRSVILTLKHFFADRHIDLFKFRVVDLPHPSQA